MPRYIKTIPRLGYSFIAAVAADPATTVSTAATEATDGRSAISIVVLPFVNLTGHLGDEYFSDGLSEELTNVLTQVDGLKVIARTSAFAYKGKNEDVRRIADALGVSDVVEGSVRRSGERLRVTVQLIRASDGVHRLSKRYDYEIADVFAMQDEISADVVRQLHLHLGTARPATSSVDAYQAQLEGRFHWNRYSAVGFVKALECFELASRLDPSYASAYTGIAQSLLGLVKEGSGSALQLLPRAAEAAKRALDLDDSDAEAHASLGEVAALLEYDWENAARHFETALDLNPSTYVRTTYAIYYLIPQGRTAEALAQSERVLANDPLNIIGHQLRAAAFMFARDYASAERSCLRLLELNETFPRGLQLMAMVKSYQDKHEAAMQWTDRLIQVIGRGYFSLHTLGMVHAWAGNSQVAQAAVAELTKLPGIGERFSTGIGLIYVTLRDSKNAILWLTRAVEQREPAALWIHMLPRGSTMRPDPRFQKIIETMRLSLQ